MLPVSGNAVVRAIMVIPVILLVLYAGLLGLLGLLCGRERRKYVMNLSRQAMGTASLLMHGPAVMNPQPRRVPELGRDIDKPGLLGLTQQTGTFVSVVM